MENEREQMRRTFAEEARRAERRRGERRRSCGVASRGGGGRFCSELLRVSNFFRIFIFFRVLLKKNIHWTSLASLGRTGRIGPHQTKIN